jgi:hypothetical protein
VRGAETQPGARHVLGSHLQPKVRLTRAATPGRRPGGKITYDGAQVTLTAPAATAATNSSPYGFSQAQADAIVTWIRAADAQLKLLGAV